MIKKSKRNRMNQQQQQKNRQVRKTVSRLYVIDLLGAVPNQVSSTHACSHRERIEGGKKCNQQH